MNGWNLNLCVFFTKQKMFITEDRHANHYATDAALGGGGLGFEAISLCYMGTVNSRLG